MFLLGKKAVALVPLIFKCNSNKVVNGLDEFRPSLNGVKCSGLIRVSGAVLLESVGLHQG